ncbi:MAG: hypothetical protein RL667_1248, partial [Pseudomonadota bacterium]
MWHIVARQYVAPQIGLLFLLRLYNA